MEDESNPVKDILYKKIDEIGEKVIQRLVTAKRYSELIKKIMLSSIDEVTQQHGDRFANIATLLTSTLHYLFTISLIPSQRKLVQNGIVIDIVIPDIRTLNSKHENALIICIPTSANPEIIKSKITELKTIQPKKDNIWIVLENNIKLEQRVFSIDDGSFYHIGSEVEKFLASKKQTQFKIFSAK